MMNNQRGFSLLELLIAMIISSIALLGAAAPFIAERSFWASGKRQVEAQRDAQMALRSMARFARQGNGYVIGGSSGNVTIVFTRPSGNVCFEGGPTFNNGQLRRFDGTCGSPAPTILIDGVRSKVTQLVFTSVTTNKLVNIQLQVTRENQQNETLQTDLFLRNA